MAIQTRRDSKRGCGWRKPGGLYLVAEGTGRPCGALPIPLTRCPTCDCGIKPSRGWAWLTVDPLLGPAVALCKGAPVMDGIERSVPDASRRSCSRCPANNITGRHGLLWIGEQFYKTPQDWLEEATTQGISRRISTLPKGFKLGEHWVLVAHRKVILNPDGTYTPAIFQMFKPSAVEYITFGDETEEEIEALEKRGITPVKVERVAPVDLFTEQAEDLPERFREPDGSEPEEEIDPPVHEYPEGDTAEQARGEAAEDERGIY